MDPYAPATANYQPQKPMSLTDMLGLAKGVQDFQQTQQMNPLLLQQQQQAVEQARQMNPSVLQEQRQKTETGRMALTIDQAKFQEQQDIQQFMADKNNYLDAYGDIDMARVMQTVPARFPFLGKDLTNRLAEMSQKQSESNTAKLHVNASMRDLVAKTGISAVNSGVTTLDGIKNVFAMMRKENPGTGMERLLNAYEQNLESMGFAGDENIGKFLMNGFVRLEGEGKARYAEELIPGLSPDGKLRYKQTDLKTGETNIVTSGNPLQASNTMSVQGGPTIEGGPTPILPIDSKKVPVRELRTGYTPELLAQHFEQRNALAQSTQSSQQALGSIEQLRSFIPQAISGAQFGIKEMASNWWNLLAPDEKARKVRDATEVVKKTIAQLQGSSFAGKSGQSVKLLENTEAQIPGLDAGPEAMLTVADQLETVAMYPLFLDYAIRQAESRATVKESPYVYRDTLDRFNEVSDLNTLEYASLHNRSKDTAEFNKSWAEWATRHKISEAETNRVRKNYERFEMLMLGDIKGFNESRPKRFEFKSIPKEMK